MIRIKVFPLRKIIYKLEIAIAYISFITLTLFLLSMLFSKKEKLIDAKIELAMLKDKAKDVMAMFTEDITSLQ